MIGTVAALWRRYDRTMQVRLRLQGAGPHGRLRGTWNTRKRAATAVLAGRLDGHRVRLTFRAP